MNRHLSISVGGESLQQRGESKKAMGLGGGGVCVKSVCLKPRKGKSLVQEVPRCCHFRAVERETKTNAR